MGERWSNFLGHPCVNNDLSLATRINLSGSATGGGVWGGTFVTGLENCVYSARILDHACPRAASRAHASYARARIWPLPSGGESSLLLEGGSRRLLPFSAWSRTEPPHGSRLTPNSSPNPARPQPLPTKKNPRRAGRKKERRRRRSGVFSNREEISNQEEEKSGSARDPQPD